MNQQPPEKQVSHPGHSLLVNSIFYTIQGEGPHAGVPAVFIRLAGCNLQCPLCDTEYTQRKLIAVEDIVLEVGCLGRYGGLVVITGGEPFRQPLKVLIETLLNNDHQVQVETNGTLHQDGLPYGEFDIVCSPKAGTINKKLAPYIKAYKYVASVDSLEGSKDGLPTHALEHPTGKGGLARPRSAAAERVEIYLQPVDELDEERNKANLDAVIASCMKYGYRLCVQTHKLVGLP